MLYQLYLIVTFDNFLNNFIRKKRSSIFWSRKWHVIGPWKRVLVRLLGSSALYLTSVLAYLNVICWFFWDPLHYDASDILLLWCSEFRHHFVKVFWKFYLQNHWYLRFLTCFFPSLKFMCLIILSKCFLKGVKVLLFQVAVSLF